MPFNNLSYSKKTNLILTCLELEYHERDENEETARLDYMDRKTREPGEIYSHFCYSQVYIYFNIFLSLPHEVMRCYSV